jgi:hypothetical protein
VSIPAGPSSSERLDDVRHVVAIRGGDAKGDAKVGKRFVRVVPRAPNSRRRLSRGSECRQSRCAAAIPNIPPKASRKWKYCFWPYFYRARNAIELCSAAREPSGEWRRAMTETLNFLTAVCNAATVSPGPNLTNISHT